MFRFFRRYQKTFIVVGGVILMFVFTIGDSLTGMFQGGGGTRPGGAPGDEAVTWNGGKLTNSEMGQLYARAEILDQFVMRVWGTGRAVADEQGLGHLPPQVRPVGLISDPRTGGRLSNEVIQTKVVRTHILAEKAREQGMDISDDTILSYIRDLGWGQLDGEMISAIVASSNPRGRPPTVNQVLDALRNELLAASMMSSIAA
ncbi:MAG: hypothetical protein ACR2NU_05820, partial [Aeoliella sp.]